MNKMKFFVATSYSSQVDYSTGRVFPAYREFLEAQLSILEQFGEVFCAIRHDNYQINSASPEEAFRLDSDEIKNCDVFIAFLGDKISAGVQTELGIALASGKKVLLAQPEGHDLEYFNNAMVRAGVIELVGLPLDVDDLRTLIL